MKASNLKTYLTVALFGGAMALPMAAHAADNAAQPAQKEAGQTAKAKMSAQDREFMVSAAQGGMLEVEASRLALERASSGEVRQFAQQLMMDHTDANEKLMGIAQEKGIQLPRQLDAKHKQQLDKLGKLKGEEFERAYMSEMGHKDHRKDIQAFEKQARQGKDPELRTFAEETLPVLQKHLSMAQKVTDGAASAQAGGGATSGADAKQ